MSLCSSVAPFVSCAGAGLISVLICARSKVSAGLTLLPDGDFEVV